MTTTSSTSSAFDATLASLGITRSTSTTATTSGKGLNEMGSADFIALMTAQMKNQDPFEPMDNSQMVAQMAQFSSLAGITEMGSTLKAISEKLGGSTTSDALSYVGKTVLVPGTTAYPRTSGGIAGSIELGADASDVMVTITNANGEVLKSVNLGSHAAGTVDFDWDGTTDSGEEAGSGPFTITANARNGATTVASTPLVWAPVSSVTMPAGTLNLPGLGQVAPSAVRSVG